MLSERKSQGEVGFQKLHKFNIALLRKQSWRLLTKPKSLIAKVLKTRYFPSCSVLDASLGSNPSYTRSMLDKIHKNKHIDVILLLLHQIQNKTT